MTRKEVEELNKNNVYTGKSKKNYGKTYFAKKNFNKSDIVMAGWGEIIDHQTSHISVQIDKNKHYLPFKWTGKYWNHSCNSNTYIKTRKDGFPNLIALKNIKAGDEITYSYWMTEFSWIKEADENKVKCKCGELRCRGKILSFTQLKNKEKSDLLRKGLCSEYLLKSI